MHRILIVFYLLIATDSWSYSQNASAPESLHLSNYQRLTSQGALPLDFRISQDENYNLQKSGEDYLDKKSYVNDFQEFQYASDFYMNILLRSGAVVFGDTVSQYLNRVKNIILASNPEIRDKIRIYTLRSEEVNAFTSDGGIIIVTTGLFERLNNEAELAFILCHEVNHYIQKHSIKFYGAAENNKSTYGYEYVDNVTSLFKYSRNLESEADLFGAKLFMKTQYNPDAIKSAFDILAFSDYPSLFELPDKNFFNDAFYQLPSDYFAASLIPPFINENTDDEKATHPSIKKRREAIQKTLNAAFDTTGYDFLVDENWFNCIKIICRYDLSQTAIDEGNYGSAILRSLQQLQSERGDKYFEKKMADALYGYALFGYQKKKAVTVRDSAMLSREQFYQLTSTIPELEMQILALRYNWLLYQKDTMDSVRLQICGHLMRRITTKYETMPETFVFIGAKSPDYWKNAFHEIPDQQHFIELFNQNKIATNKRPVSYRSNSSKKFKIYAIGAEKVILMEPVYIKHTNLDEDAVAYVASGKAKEALAEKIFDCADKLDLAIEYFDPIEFDSTATQKFNDMAMINTWFIKALEANTRKIDVSNFYHEDLIKIADRYQTDFVAWTGVITYVEPEQMAALKIVVGILMPPFLPLVVADLTTNNYTYYLTIVANIRTGEIIANYINESRMTDSDELQKSNLYFILQQIKTKPK